MPKPKFNPQSAAEKFISGVKPTEAGAVPATATAADTTPKLTQKAYYITPEQHKNIKLLAIEKGTDASAVLREAIDTYLKLQ